MFSVASLMAYAGLAEKLGAIHGGVGAAQNLFGVEVVWAAGGDADADGDEDGVAVDEEGGLKDGLDAFGDADAVLEVGEVVEEDDELVAAGMRATESKGRRQRRRCSVCSERVFFAADGLKEAVGYAFHELVADGVTEAVR